MRLLLLAACSDTEVRGFAGETVAPVCRVPPDAGAPGLDAAAESPLP